MRIRVTGFPNITDKDDIRRLFSKYGTVDTIEKAYGTSIAYVTMPYEHQGEKAVNALDGTKILGRLIIVEECFL